MGSKKKTTVGHRYFLGLHMGLCRGEIDELVAIKVGDRTAWEGSITGNTSIQIDQPNLFGGDDKEGGIAGRLDVMMGGRTQGLNAELAAMLGGLVPAFRGFVSTFFDGLVCSGSPYPKPWVYRARRALKGWGDEGPWYPEKAVISLAGGAIKAMNPAHILYQCFTSQDWGRGLARARLDDAAWRAAADQLHAEGFGLCMRWNRQDSLVSFMQVVIDHIGAARYVDRQTGLIVLKLIRNDYTPEALPLFDADSGLLGIDDDDSAAQTAGTNEVVVKYRDPLTNEDRQVRVKNLASIHSAGVGVASSTREYPGLPTAELALRVAQRDLKASGGFIKKLKLRLDRRGYQVAPGSVFRISEPRRGIANLVLRAGRVEYGTLGEGTITVTALQDVFGLPATSFVAVPPSAWVPPNTQPQAVVERRLVELPYRDLAQTIDAANLALLDANSCYLAAVAVRPNGLSLSFDLVDRVGTSGSFVNRGEGAFCPSGLLAAAMTRTTTAVTVASGVSLGEVLVGTAALIDAEIVRVDAINPATGAVTLARGCSDTVPVAHAAGARIWFYDDFGGTDPTEYSTGVTLQAKLLTRTSTGVLAETAAATDSLLFSQRQYRPYPPGRLRINGVSYPGVVSNTIVVSWAARDRLLQADQLIDTTQGPIGPEAGTTYRVEAYAVNTGTVLHAQAGIAADQYTVPETLFAGVPRVGVRVFAVRSAVDSWQALQHEFDFEYSTAIVVATSGTTYAVGTAQSQTIPATAAVGDLLLAWVMHRSALAPPAGWSLVRSQSVTADGFTQLLSLYSKTAGSGDPGSSTAWSQAASERIAVHIHVCRHTNGFALAVLASQGGSATAATAIPMAVVAATAAGQIGIAGASFNLAFVSPSATALSASSGYTLTTPASQVENRLAVAWRALPAGQSTNGTITSGNSTNGGVTAVSVLVGVAP